MTVLKCDPHVNKYQRSVFSVCVRCHAVWLRDSELPECQGYDAGEMTKLDQQTNAAIKQYIEGLNKSLSIVNKYAYKDVIGFQSVIDDLKEEIALHLSLLPKSGATL